MACSPNDAVLLLTSNPYQASGGQQQAFALTVPDVCGLRLSISARRAELAECAVGGKGRLISYTREKLPSGRRT